MNMVTENIRQKAATGTRWIDITLGMTGLSFAGCRRQSEPRDEWRKINKLMAEEMLIAISYTG